MEVVELEKEYCHLNAKIRRSKTVDFRCMDHPESSGKKYCKFYRTDHNEPSTPIVKVDHKTDSIGCDENSFNKIMEEKLGNRRHCSIGDLIDHLLV